MNIQSTFLAAWLRAKNIVRWPLTTNLTSCNNAEHSFECGVVAHIIGTIDRDIFKNKETNPEHLASLALFHEGGEVAGLGDINSAAKNITPDSSKAIKALEALFEDNLLESLPEELRDSYRPLIIQNKQTRNGKLVKAADDLCALMEAQKEFNLGNYEYRDSLANQRSKLEVWRKEFECVDWFLNHFMEALGQSIDIQLKSS